MTGIDLIKQERENQLQDIRNQQQLEFEQCTAGELVDMAIALICNNGKGDATMFPEGIPPASIKFILERSYVNRLVYAGSLIVAEIDRCIKINK